MKIEVKRIDWVKDESIYYLINNEWMDSKEYKGDYRDIEGVMTRESVYAVDNRTHKCLEDVNPDRRK